MPVARAFSINPISVNENWMNFYCFFFFFSMDNIVSKTNAFGSKNCMRFRWYRQLNAFSYFTHIQFPLSACKTHRTTHKKSNSFALIARYCMHSSCVHTNTNLLTYVECVSCTHTARSLTHVYIQAMCTSQCCSSLFIRAVNLSLACTKYIYIYI